MPEKTLNQIKEEVHENAIAHGFHDFTESNTSFIHKELMNTIGEIAEIQQAWRDDSLHKLCDKAEKMTELELEPLTCIEEEYADIIIRTLDQCARLGVDIAKAVEVKHQYNKSRPFKHGRVNG